MSSVSAASTVHPYLLQHNHSISMVQNQKCSSASYAASCTIRASNPDGARIVLFFKTFRTAPWSTQPPIHWGHGFFPGDKAVRFVKVTTHLNPAPRLKLGGAGPLSPPVCPHGVDRDSC